MELGHGIAAGAVGPGAAEEEGEDAVLEALQQGLPCLRLVLCRLLCPLPGRAACRRRWQQRTCNEASPTLVTTGFQ